MTSSAKEKFTWGERGREKRERERGSERERARKRGREAVRPFCTNIISWHHSLENSRKKCSLFLKSIFVRNAFEKELCN